MPGQNSFDIYACREGRWTIDGHSTSKTEGEAVARNMLGRPGIEAVKVVQDSNNKVVFELKRGTSSSTKVFVQDIDDAPVCKSVDDLYESEGRATINRLFRSYLDKNSVTATEVMHNYREFKRLMDADTLLPSAVAKVATLQAKGGGDSSERRNVLDEFVTKVATRAREADKLKLPSATKDGFEKTVTSILDSSKPEQASFRLNVALSRDLVNTRNWYGKLTQMVEWTAPVEEERALDLSDGFIADMLCNAEVLQNVLGDQPDLAHALDDLLTLSTGTMEFDSDSEPNPDDMDYAVRKLNGFFGGESFGQSKSALLDRIQKQLTGSSPLVKGDRDKEAQAFRDLLKKLVDEDDVVGGGNMAEAIIARQSRIINKGGKAGMREAAGRVLPALDDPSKKASYLLSLADSRMAEDLGDTIQEQLNTLFVRPSSVNQIVEEGLPPNKKMEKVTSLFYKLNGSHLEDNRKEELCGRLDELLASYLVDSKILEKLNDPNRPLHIRSFMLMKMCQPEMLPAGKASELARSTILGYLRMPNFEKELVAKVEDEEEKVRIIKQFHVQMHKSGFM